jgi:hypothetical protein
LSKCPSCGAILELVVGTDYTKAQAILGTKASGSDLTNEQLAVLKWKQSQKREALSTLLVTTELLNIPIAKLLYERLKSSSNLSWKLGEITYKLSRTDAAEFLQRWSPIAAR